LSLAAPAHSRHKKQSTRLRSLRNRPDVASDCRYELTLPDSAQTIRATWSSSSAVVISRNLPGCRGSSVRSAQSLALLYPSTARRRRIETWTLTRFSGLRRGLLVALRQFADKSKHVNSRLPVDLARVLWNRVVGRGFAAYAPERVIAVIATDPGILIRSALTRSICHQTQPIPQLILVGSADAISGTQRRMRTFESTSTWLRGHSWCKTRRRTAASSTQSR